jgi:hypothetical protein
MVPKPVPKGNESTVPDFIERIIKYSELISDNKNSPPVKLGPLSVHIYLTTKEM